MTTDRPAWLDEFRMAAGMPSTRYPGYQLDEKKNPKVFLDDLNHDFTDLVNAINGEGGDPLTSAIARLRADLSAIEKMVK